MVTTAPDPATGANPAEPNSPTGGLVREFWDYAFKKSPKTARFLFAGYLLVAAAALVLSWQVSIRSLVVTAFVVLAASVVVTLLVHELSRKRSSAAGAVMLWAFIVLVLVVLSLFTSAAFFGWPPRGAVLVARLFNLPEALAGSGADKQVSPANGTWPLEATEPLDVSGDRFSRIEALKKRPSVELSAANPIRGGGTVYVDTLVLRGEAIVTEGKDLTIEALKVVSDGGVIRAFGPSSDPGETAGRPAGTVTLIVQSRIVGGLTVDLLGEGGGKGAAGATGSPGAPGRQGDNAASGLLDCQRGAGRGGDGEPGHPGGNGAQGFAGGSGGTLVLVGPNPTELERAVKAVVTGGKGGSGGSPGTGGSGGAAGPGGSPRGLCQGSGPSGAPGAKGPDGQPGPQGTAGPEGRVILRKVDENGLPL